jgi:hypothetical protein
VIRPLVALGLVACTPAAPPPDEHERERARIEALERTHAAIDEAPRVLEALARDARAFAPTTAEDCSDRTLFAKPESIRQVDWCNRRYGHVELVRGRYQLRSYRARSRFHDTDDVALAAIGYGELDDVPGEDAVVAIHAQHWSRESQSSQVELHVHRFGTHGVEAIARVPAPALPVVRIEVGEGGFVVIHQRDDGPCRAQWRWRGGAPERVTPDACG